MTVAQLIEQLKKYPSDAIVAMQIEGGGAPVLDIQFMEKYNEVVLYDLTNDIFHCSSD